MRSQLIASVLLVSLAATPVAEADSGRLHAHLELGVGGPLSGPTRPQDGQSSAGGVVVLGLDYQLSAPWALEVLFGIGAFARPFPTSNETAARYTSLVFGAKYRLWDEHRGYANEPAGDLHSHAWISAHVGFASYDKQQAQIDVGLGYLLSVARPFQIGAFLRFALMPGGDTSAVDSALLGGVAITFELLGLRGATDTDGDGLSDEREAELGTDPRQADSDRDRIPDGVEVETGTDPLQRDTDGDGLDDSEEDENRDGRVDPDETDPRRSDTDGGGIPDLAERHDPVLDPRYAGDDDRDEDGVGDHIDQCPDSAEGEEVDGTGCAELQQTINLAGVQFRSGSADILPSSEDTLRQALELLRRHPDVHFEIAGHTDSQGRERTNQRLSEQRARAVLRWLVERGVDRSRFEVRGYGSSEPIDTNETADGRARNRRIEFRRR